jgi:hypothetical protein
MTLGDCAMSVDTILTWIFLGFALLVIGTLLYAVMGIVYIGIGGMLAIIHDRHLDKRTRAGRESHR